MSHLKILGAITRAQSTFIANSDNRAAFDTLLLDVLSITDSAYGFIGEVLYRENGDPFLKTSAVTNIAWDAATRAFYDERAPDGMEFANLDTLFGAVLTTRERVIANEPATDPRSGGLPSGHPPLNAFLGLPLCVHGQMVGMLGIANRPGGYDLTLVELLEPLLSTIAQLMKARINEAERQRTEGALRQSEHRFRSLFESASVGMGLNDYETGQFLDVNAALLAPSGYSRAEFLKLSYWEVTPRAYEAQERAQLESMEATGRYGPYQKEYIRKDGSRYPVLLKGFRMQEPDGRVVIWSIIQDISELVRASTALKFQVNKTQAIIDHVGDAIITVDAAGHIRSCNRSTEQVFGYGPGELLGGDFSTLVGAPPPGLVGGFMDEVGGVNAPSEAAYNAEGRRENGRVFPVHVVVSRISWDGDPFYLVVIRDVTEQRRVERLKSEFVATVSHELRTPLTSISGAIDLVVGGVLGVVPEAMKPLLEIAQRNSQQLSHLINDLLDIEQIEAGKMRYDLSAQAIAPLVLQAMQANEVYGAKYGVQFVFEAPSLKAHAQIDAHRLIQILSNFLSNAVKFSPQGASVEISIQTDSERVRISVADHGCGISDIFRARIFEKFSQADASSARGEGSTGLGLAICKRLAGQMGGAVGFDSEVGHGATFFVEFPLVDR